MKSVVRDLCDKLMQFVGNNHPLSSFFVNAVVLYIAEEAHKRNTSFTQKTAMELNKRIVNDLNAETRDVLLNSFFNEMRYPNSHTHFFSCTILYFFADQTKDIITEQITR